MNSVASQKCYEEYYDGILYYVLQKIHYFLLKILSKMGLSVTTVKLCR